MKDNTISELRDAHAAALSKLQEATAKRSHIEADLTEARKQHDFIISSGAKGVTQAQFSAASNKVTYLEVSLSGAIADEGEAIAELQRSASALASVEASNDGRLSIAREKVGEAKGALSEALHKLSDAVASYNDARGSIAHSLKEAGAIAGEVSPFAPAFVTPKNSTQPEMLTIHGELVHPMNYANIVQSVIAETSKAGK